MRIYYYGELIADTKTDNINAAKNSTVTKATQIGDVIKQQFPHLDQDNRPNKPSRPQKLVIGGYYA